MTFCNVFNCITLWVISSGKEKCFQCFLNGKVTAINIFLSYIEFEITYYLFHLFSHHSSDTLDDTILLENFIFRFDKISTPIES